MTVAGDVGRERGYSARGRSDWQRAEVEAFYAARFAELMFRVQSVHRENVDPNQLEAANFLSINPAGSPETCGYCSQSAHYETALKAAHVMDCADLVATVRRQSRGCDGLLHDRGWRSPKVGDLGSVCEMVRAVKGLGMETCVTLRILNLGRAVRRAESGLDFHSHNVEAPRRSSGQDHHEAGPAGPHRPSCTCTRCRHQGVQRLHCPHGRAR